MKNLFTLALIIVAMATFAQNTLLPHQQKYYRNPASAMPPSNFHSQQGVSRSISCDTATVLDYSTYNEIIADQMGIYYVGSWNYSDTTIQATEVTSFVDTAHQYLYDYVGGAWDSLAFANYFSGITISYPFATSAVYLDSLGMFIGLYSPDTSETGMEGDSLYFTIYAIINDTVQPEPVNTIVLGGYQGLQPFLQPLNTLTYVQIPIGQPFSQGQGFAIVMDYLAQDTSSHLLLSYSYADSCGTVLYSGTTYNSPAYPSPFAGSTFYGQITPVQGTSFATVTAGSNQFGYFGDGFAYNCSFVYTQNWEFLPIVRWDTLVLPPAVATAVSITGTDTICTGTDVLFTATPTNGGTNPSYIWEINGMSTGDRSSTFSYDSLANGDTVTCILFSSLTCPAPAAILSNAIQMDVTAYPPAPSFTHNGDTLVSNAPSGNQWLYYGNPIPGATGATYVIDSTGVYQLEVTNGNNCTSYSTPQNDTLISGISNVTAIGNVKVFPNPFNNNIMIQIGQEAKNISTWSLTVKDILGNTIVVNDKLSYNNTLDLSDLTAGVYFLSLNNEEGNVTYKLVKQQ